MEIEYDAAKDKANIKKHGVSFEEVLDIDWDSAVILCDDRVDYGEIRYLGYVVLGSRLHILIWTWRGKALRPISFRKANIKERKYYEKEKTN